MKTAALALAASVISVEAQSADVLFLEQSQHLEATTSSEPEQVYLWKNWDYFMGAMIGLYLPLNNYANNYDCQSELIMSGTKLAMYSSYFDHKLKSEAMPGLWFAILFDIVGWVNTYQACSEQYDSSLADDWYDHYDSHAVRIGAEEEDENHLLKRMVKGLKVASSLQKFIYYMDNNLYHFQKAFYLMFAVGNATVLGLDLAGSDLIAVQNRYVRYYDE